MNKLTTPRCDELDRSLPWSDYPRPALVREAYISLNGEWDFAVSKRATPPQSYGEKILVPFPPESAISGIGRTHSPGEYLFYKRRFTLPDEFRGKRVILHFGAVDQLYTVFINGKSVYDGAGGYIPKSHDITDSLLSENEITVRVYDALSRVYPWGKQKRRRGGMWYTAISGIWQSVWLEAVGENYIEGLKITPGLKSVNIKLIGGAGKKVITLDCGEQFEFYGEEINISPKEIHLWTPDSPHLYYFTLETDTDRVRSYFALRTVTVEKVSGIPRILLNGEPYFFNALLDQGYYPDGIFLPPTKDSYSDDILLAKSLGFNTLRKHVKIEPLIFYHLCDKLGMVVFQDMVNNSDYSFLFHTALPSLGLKRIPDRRLHRNKKSRKVFIDTMYEAIELLYNSPSVLYYTIFNEGWGQFTADKVYSLAKAKDGTRIYDTTSGWFYQKESDVESHHVYRKKIKLKAAKERPIVVSEFGGYSYRVPGHLFCKKNYGYKSFGDRESYEDAIIELYENEVKPYISLGLSAAVLTQLSDIEEETNGIVSYDRRVVKLSVERMRSAMAELKKEILS